MTYNFSTGIASKRIQNASDYNFLCDRCGVAYNNTEIHKEWTGLIVCSRCYEPKHTLLDESKYMHPERNLPSIVRPEISYPEASACSIRGMFAAAGIAEAGCARAEINDQIFLGV